MTTRNLDALFLPKKIALIGASNKAGSVGSVLARNLFEGGFNGPIMTVNPHEETIHSRPNYPSIGDLPDTPDLAVIATPPATVPGIVAELGARGCRAAVVITAGFGEGADAEGTTLRTQMLQAAAPHVMRLIGPNCLGFISPGVGVNATFAHLMPASGHIAMITQSGAIATALLDWAAGKSIGFSHLISLGDMSDVDFGDLLDYLSLDQATRAILLYIENITSPRKFMSAARIAARTKPVIVVKSGRTDAGSAAAMSHTGALAGSDAVYDAAFRRAGMLRVIELRELFEMAELLDSGLRITGDRLTVLTNGGGAGVMAADALEERLGKLARLSERSIAELNAVLPRNWSHNNPIDILGDAKGDRYVRTLDVLARSVAQDAILVINCPTGLSDSTDIARHVLSSISNHPETPILSCWLGEATAAPARKVLAEKGVPSFETPDDAVRAFMHLYQYGQNQRELLETPAARATPIAYDSNDAHDVTASVLKSGRTLLTEPEAKRLLSAYRIPVTETLIAKNADEAADCARRLGFPVALKILSPDITHKSDVGGVRLNLEESETIRTAAVEMLESIKRRSPNARIDGFTVQRMVNRDGAIELIAGIASDPTFGPIVLFGQGGVAVELVADRAIGLPPLNSVLARQMIERTRVARLLKGYRNVHPVQVEAIESALVCLSELVIDHPEIVEIDINPLLSNENGIHALDARVVVRANANASQRFVISPYPAHLQKDAELPNGRRIFLRPIRPEDKPMLVDMVNSSTADDVRLRFFNAFKELPDQLSARLSQIDYDREMAIVALASRDERDARMLGVARLVGDPNNETAEFAIMVRSDLKGQGIGYRLMQELLSFAAARGLQYLRGQVQRQNTVMLNMIRELGAKIKMTQGVPEIVDVTFDLARLPRGARAS